MASRFDPDDPCEDHSTNRDNTSSRSARRKLRYGSRARTVSEGLDAGGGAAASPKASSHVVNIPNYGATAATSSKDSKG